MAILEALRMNKGEGKTSYAKNSGVQRDIISLGNSIIKETLVHLLGDNFPDSMGIADLGCASGQNTLLAVSEIMESVKEASHQMGHQLPELRVFLNDLPTNDFNGIFVSLPSFYKKLEQEKGITSDRCFISGVPGSFYGRLFPSKSLHFVHSSSSLHWLSQVPPALDAKASVHLNKGKLAISKTSPDGVFEAYRDQYQKDLSLFLKSRSEEVVPGGRMVLSFMGRTSSDPCPSTDSNWYQVELLANAIMSMASDGLIEEEKIDSFNAAYYNPCVDEIVSVIGEEGSFAVHGVETFKVDWAAGSPSQTLSSGQKVATAVRSVMESMFEDHFGREFNLDELFTRYALLVDDHLSKTPAKLTNLVISLVRKAD